MTAWHWLSRKDKNEAKEEEERESPVTDAYNIQIRKSSCYHGKMKVNRNISKPAKRTFADRIGIKSKKKEAEIESQIDDFIYEHSDDLDTITKDDELVYFRATKIVPKNDLRIAMSRLRFLLDICCPGSAPDPMLIASVLDMVCILKLSK